MQVTVMAAFHWIQTQALNRTFTRGMRHTCLNHKGWDDMKGSIDIIVDNQTSADDSKRQKTEGGCGGSR